MKPTPAVRVYISTWTWIALVVLLALTCGSSFIAMGRFNLIANVAIAVAKALLVAIFFMHVLKAGHAVRLVAIAGIVWLTFLVVLSANDFTWRGP